MPGRPSRSRRNRQGTGRRAQSYCLGFPSRGRLQAIDLTQNLIPDLVVQAHSVSAPAARWHSLVLNANARQFPWGQQIGDRNVEKNSSVRPARTGADHCVS
jgi:hypothetical protein